MQMAGAKYRGFLIHLIVTTAEVGRYTVAANSTDRDGEMCTLGVEGDFAGPNEARDQAKGICDCVDSSAQRCIGPLCPQEVNIRGPQRTRKVLS